MAKTSPKVSARRKRIQRIRKKISGTAERPRLRIFKSAKHIYAQVIDDTSGNTLVSMSTVVKDARQEDLRCNCDGAHKIGKLLAERAKGVGITQVVLDRGGFIYHGRVKALGEGAREGGLIF